ncbi:MULTISPECIES: DUF1304 domain-containing protein [Acinetobacter]|jgi:putative membrane protein|uniref:DUF1304 domain-containing protein n=2 Tax=Acinetobacter TaxID=469 RepID=A0A4V2DP03_9GAMM|nr:MULTISPECIES: DUF1304 domain-containing protein [Acinetobacter]MCW8037833.1 DUF1304 domain-containing protein [Acinetobacter entericus]RZG64930.1 DUF1304 domain-containing protein [Acinetobacter bouvetii]TCB74627.1 DUF1304 domain-containing protein [Acinetobacter sp. ANC 4177]
MLSQILIVIIALLHIYFLVLEMFLWQKPAGLKAFGNTPEKAALTKVLAQNQGLYNGFLAAGLIWSLLVSMPFSFMLANFFLICVLIAGIYGSVTASRKILYIQALPALAALILLNLGV